MSLLDTIARLAIPKPPEPRRPHDPRGCTEHPLVDVVSERDRVVAVRPCATAAEHEPPCPCSTCAPWPPPHLRPTEEPRP